MQLEQFANPKGHGVLKALFCGGTGPVRSSVRKSLVFRIAVLSVRGCRYWAAVD